MTAPSIAIVVPVLNEAGEVPGLLDCLRALGDDAEIVVVDGGSTDGTPDLLRAAGRAVVASPPGRARQMNAGARATRGEILVFLHADARLTPEALTTVRHAMRDGRVVGGRFDLVYETARWPYPLIAWLGNVRSRVTGVATGDQTIFVRRTAFDAVAGYPEIPLMEDVELSRRLKRRGRVVALRARVVGSTRKYRRDGVWRTVGLMWLVRALYALGGSPATLHRLYYRTDPSKRPS